MKTFLAILLIILSASALADTVEERQRASALASLLESDGTLTYVISSSGNKDAELMSATAGYIAGAFVGSIVSVKTFAAPVMIGHTIAGEAIMAAPFLPLLAGTFAGAIVGAGVGLGIYKGVTTCKENTCIDNATSAVSSKAKHVAAAVKSKFNRVRTALSA